jgi:hypothetical protein
LLNQQSGKKSKENLSSNLHPEPSAGELNYVEAFTHDSVLFNLLKKGASKNPKAIARPQTAIGTQKRASNLMIRQKKLEKFEESFYRSDQVTLDRIRERERGNTFNHNSSRPGKIKQAQSIRCYKDQANLHRSLLNQINAKDIKTLPTFSAQTTSPLKNSSPSKLTKKVLH